MSRKYQNYYPLFYATLSVFLSFSPTVPGILFAHTRGIWLAGQISSISCNLKVRYCLRRSRYQLLSQEIFLQLIFKLCFSIFLSFTTAMLLYFFLQIWKGLCPESIRIIVLFSTPLSLYFCLSALLSLEFYLPIPEVQKLLILHVTKNIFINLMCGWPCIVIQCG